MIYMLTENFDTFYKLHLFITVWFAAKYMIGQVSALGITYIIYFDVVNIFQFGFMNEMTAYNTQYKCYSVSMMAGNDRADVEKGGKSKSIKLFIPASRFLK